MVERQDFASDAQALAALNHLDVPELEVLYKLERTAAHLYDLLADRIGNEDAAELFRRNGREELGHARRARRAIVFKLGHGFEPPSELQEWYPLELPTMVSSDLLASLLSGEQAGELDYQRWAESEAHPEVARLLRLNGREETLHGERVAKAIAILQSTGEA